MLSDTQLRQYQRDGFLKGPKILPDDEVETLRAELDRVIRDQDTPAPQPVLIRNISKDNATLWQIVNIWQASDAFRSLIYHPQLVRAVAQMLGEAEVRLWHDQIQYKPAGKGGLNFWHQDSPYWPPLLPKDRQVTAWVALDEVDEDNGCMRMVPGSQAWGDQIAFLHARKSHGFDSMPSEFQGHPVEVRSCPVEKGAVHFHHSLTWHGSGENHSSRPRRAVALHFMAGSTVYKNDGSHPMQEFIRVPEGAKIVGDHFPLIWNNGPVVPSKGREFALA